MKPEGHDRAAGLAEVLREFFDAKTARDLEATMAYFAPDMVAYIDATLATDPDLAQRLWERSAELTGLSSRGTGQVGRAV
jgi:ketosteroid isomerase-like protein